MKVSIRNRVAKLPRWLSFLILEGWPIVILLFAIAIEFAHIAETNWLQLFLYNGDSLTLPVIGQSLAHKDPFLWVSSSQFLIFPEGLLYAISSALTTSVRAALVFNGALNVLILYALFRWAAGILLISRRYFKQLFALVCSLLLIFYMLLERNAAINDSSLATLFIFTTYYYGVIISGGFSLCTTLKQTRSLVDFRRPSAPQIILASTAFVITALTTFSDPIFLVQFVLPVLIALGLAFLLNGLNLKQIIFGSLPLVTGSIVGYVARLPFKVFLGESLKNHILTQQIPYTLTVFHQSLSRDLHSKSGLLELFLILAVIGVSFVYSGWWIYQKTLSKHNELSGQLLLLALFSVIGPVLIVMFSIFTGSKVTRYLLPLVIFPLFGLLPLFAGKSIKINKKIATIVSVLILFVIVSVGAVSISKANRILSDTFPGANCLSSALNHQPAYGVGEYWTVRTLNVYGQFNEQALQIGSGFRPYLWQYNLGSFLNKKVSFILVNKQSSTSPMAILPDNPYIPPNPSSKYTCPDMYVYVYNVNTTGYRMLNETINKSVANALRLRAAGQASEIN